MTQLIEHGLVQHDIINNAASMPTRDTRSCKHMSRTYLQCVADAMPLRTYTTACSVEAFERFALRHMQRHIPVGPITAQGLHMLPETAGYRLAVHAIEGLPTDVLAPETLQLRVSLSLFNQSNGRFVGSTVHSMPLKHGFRPSQRCVVITTANATPPQPPQPA